MAVCAAAFGLVAFGSVAVASSTFTSHVKLQDAQQDPNNADKTIFTMKVNSDQRNCVKARTVTFAERKAGTNKPFVKVAAGKTDGDGKVVKSIGTKNFPDVKVTAIKKTFGKPSHKKTCLPKSTILTAN